MKKILLILLLLPCFAKAQLIQKVNTYGYEYQRVIVDTLIAIPGDTLRIPAAYQSFPFIARKGTTVYLWNTSTLAWEALTAVSSMVYPGAGIPISTGAAWATSITNSSTVGQVLRVTGASTYGFGAVDLADGDAITGFLPKANGGTAENNGTGGTANTFWARPAGAAGASSYRAIVAGDLPGTSPYTLQQVLTAGSVLTKTNTVTIPDIDTLSFVASGSGGDVGQVFRVSSPYHDGQIILNDNTSYAIHWHGQVRLASEDDEGNENYRIGSRNPSGQFSGFSGNMGNGYYSDFNYGSVFTFGAGITQFTPHLGNFFIDTLNNETFTNTLVGWTSTAGVNRGKLANVTLSGGLSMASGVLSSSTVATAVPLSGITAATGANTIDNVGYKQSWIWTALTSDAGFSISSTGTGAASNGQTLFSASTSGANSTSTQTTYAAIITNSHSGTASTNIAGNFGATNGTVNNAINISAGALTLNSSAGTSGQVLTSAGANTLPTWTTPTTYSGTNFILNQTSQQASSNFNISGAGVIGTTLTVPTVIGGTSTTSDLNLQTTSGVGTTGADMHFLVGNNGATEAMTILNNANVGIGTTAPLQKQTVISASPGVTPLYAGFAVLSNSSSAYTSLAVGRTAPEVYMAVSGGANEYIATTVAGDAAIIYSTGKLFFGPIIGGDAQMVINNTTGSINIPTSASILTLGGGATASKLRFMEPSVSGTNYSEFEAVAQAGNISYRLPPTAVAGGVWTDVAGNGVLTSVAPLTTTSGTYTPTLSNTTNVTSSTPIVCHYTRVGDEITVTGSVGVVTTLAVATVLGISLPVGSNDFGVTTDCSGTGSASSAIATNAYVEGNVSTNIAELKFIGLSVGGNGVIFFTFTYTFIVP